MLSSLEEARLHCRISDEEAHLLLSPAAPILLLPWLESSDICRPVAPNLLYLGIMLPYTPLHHLLLRAAALPLVMTSGNLSEEPIAAQNDEALGRLGDIADYFLLHNRDIAARYDDSVAFVLDGKMQIVRRARGFAPFPLRLELPGKAVLALGADEKNTFCLARDQHAFVSQHIGDMDGAETQEHLQNTLQDYKHTFRVEPQLIAHDLHPDYHSTTLARELARQSGIPTLAVQHHHAHIASCMADNALKGKIIGVALDGTGYGTDGNIWGGEFFIAGYDSFQRCGHLQYLPLPGGDAGIKRPYRIAAAYLRSLLGLSPVEIHGYLSRYAPLEEFELVTRQISRGLNTPLTSSMGRLFDAVSALLGVRGVIQYDAQAAIELEMKASTCTDNIKQAYPFKIREKNPYIIVVKELFSEIITDLQKGLSLQAISLKFHLSVTAIVLEMCRIMRDDSGISDVALSGGVFQNRLLLGISITTLRGDGFRVYTHKDVPCNDGGISLGQAAVARATMI